MTANISNGGASPAYQWQDSTATNNWQNISGAVNATLNYAPAQTGDKVRCMLTSNANCATPATATSAALSFTVNFPTGVNPVNAVNQGIKFYPNPVHSTLIIDSLKISDKWETAEISGIDGKQKLITVKLHNQTRVSVPVGNLAAGTYIIILNRKQGAGYFKFVKM